MTESFGLMWRNKKTVGLFFLTYSLIYILFVGAFAGGTDLKALRSGFEDYFGGGYGKIIAGSAVFGTLLASVTVTNDASSTIYQIILFIIMSLAFIRFLRRTDVKDVPKRLRDAFYGGMSPLVPLLLVLLVISLEMIPLAITTFAVSVINQNSLVSTNTEWFAVGSVAFLLVFFSFYLVSGSLMAVYIVALPDMTPMKALRSAHSIVSVQRWTVLRRIITLVLTLLLLTALVILPAALLLPSSVQWLAQWLVAGMLLIDFVLAHGYLYRLYRSLL